MNDKEKELQFLQIARLNGNLYHLVLADWSYRDIVRMMSQFSRKGIVSVSEQGTLLTSKGNEYFKSLYKSLGKRGIDRFLSPAIDRKHESFSKESIYVPTTF